MAYKESVVSWQSKPVGASLPMGWLVVNDDGEGNFRIIAKEDTSAIPPTITIHDGVERREYATAMIVQLDIKEDDLRQWARQVLKYLEFRGEAPTIELCRSFISTNIDTSLHGIVIKMPE